MEIIYRKRDRWTYPRTLAQDRRGRSAFKADYRKTMALLKSELRHLDVKKAIIQVDTTDYWIRNDGQLRVDAKIETPGIVINFNSPLVGDLCYPCDSCDCWRHNVRSVALALEALRAVDRYGVSSLAQQYTGWARLAGPTDDSVVDGPPPPTTTATWTKGKEV